VHGDEADEVLLKLGVSSIAEAPAAAGAAVRPASPWADRQACQKPVAAIVPSVEQAEPVADQQEQQAASPTIEVSPAVPGASCVEPEQPSPTVAAAFLSETAPSATSSGLTQPSRDAAAATPSHLTPTSRAAMVAKVGSGRRLLQGRSPAGRQLSVGEALNKAARGPQATARKLEDAFAGSAAALPSVAAVAPQMAAPLLSAASQPAQAGGDVALPSYLQAALAAADSTMAANAPAAALDAEIFPSSPQQLSATHSAAVCLQAAPYRADKRKAADIERLPPVAELDASVLDALPLHLKRELEMAYGAQHSFLRSRYQVC